MHGGHDHDAFNAEDKVITYIDENGVEVHEHTHDHGDGIVHTHVHTHSHGDEGEHEHSHHHDPEDIKRIVNRMARSIGHMESVKRMVENGYDCSDVLIQLSAVKAELNSVGKLILKGHMEHCIVDAVRDNDQAAIEKMNDAIDRFIK